MPLACWGEFSLHMYNGSRYWQFHERVFTLPRRL
jgi:hypothetical protein